MKGYESCKTPDEASLLLSDLITDGRTQRRIGPQLSKRTYTIILLRHLRLSMCS